MASRRRDGSMSPRRLRAAAGRAVIYTARRKLLARGVSYGRATPPGARCSTRWSN